MKLEKLTENAERIENASKKARRRWYDDACGTALALELVGERWALMVVRELMFGPRRFGEIRNALPGLSANVLTQRLEGLEESGILKKRRLPPPANAQVYELTPWGYEAEVALQVLGRWAVRSPEHDPTLPLSAASMMMSLRTMHSTQLAGDLDFTIGFRMGEGDEFLAHYSARGIDIARGDASGADVILAGPPPAVAGAVYGGALAKLEAQGILSVEGDHRLAQAFVGRFPLPPKWTNDA
ncbi:winged helix-turn-helix transcriptional regulator [Sphingomonas turrisvirgatae]|uniref:Transcriptional regulator n=1 Tax=Sphingomonas turrisvirgatae TaxID=1888892 RepID=A0A1E3LTQ5_9SPHN|nr:helix-turn-helix domain-containing protein [Sphingomonas turrisvirgatae]ODP37094.1 transcriptional regulator [Sphingomonas turrisvirgatae]